MSRIYVASSWRCEHQPSLVFDLRAAGHEVYDFRNPTEGNRGFHWSEIDRSWEKWDSHTYRDALTDPVAERGFSLDFEAMKWADTCVLVLPCGRSAHLEAGYFVGAGKDLHILILERCEPELMYKMATSICLSIPEVLEAIKPAQETPRAPRSDGWISVKERLPESPSPKDPTMGWQVYRPRGWHKVDAEYEHPAWWADMDGREQEITHWRELPSPPSSDPPAEAKDARQDVMDERDINVDGAEERGEPREAKEKA